MAEPIKIPKEVYMNALQLYIDALIARYDELGLRSTGNWAKELKAIILSETKAVIEGEHYTYQLVHGRKPGKRPPIDPIEDWVNIKLGITGKQGRSVAFAVSKKIAEEGTNIYQKGGTNLLEVLDEPQLFKVFTDSIGEYIKVQASAILLRQVKTLTK